MVVITDSRRLLFPKSPSKKDGAGVPVFEAQRGDYQSSWAESPSSAEMSHWHTHDTHSHENVHLCTFRLTAKVLIQIQLLCNLVCILLAK